MVKPTHGEVGERHVAGESVGAVLDLVQLAVELGFGFPIRSEAALPPLPTPARVGITTGVEHDRPTRPTLANVPAHGLTRAETCQQMFANSPCYVSLSRESFSDYNALTRTFAVGRRGLEPRTLGLKVPCSTG